MNKKIIKRVLTLALALAVVISLLPAMPVNAKSVKLSQTKATVLVGGKISLKLENASSVEWTTSSSAKAKVSSKGVVSGKKAGTVTITAKDKNTGKKYKCKVYVIKEFFNPESGCKYKGGKLYIYANKALRYCKDVTVIHNGQEDDVNVSKCKVEEGYLVIKMSVSSWHVGDDGDVEIGIWADGNVSGWGHINIK